MTSRLPDRSVHGRLRWWRGPAATPLSGQTETSESFWKEIHRLASVFVMWYYNKESIRELNGVCRSSSFDLWSTRVSFQRFLKLDFWSQIDRESTQFRRVQLYRRVKQHVRNGLYAHSWQWKRDIRRKKTRFAASPWHEIHAVRFPWKITFLVSTISKRAVKYIYDKFSIKSNESKGASSVLFDLKEKRFCRCLIRRVDKIGKNTTMRAFDIKMPCNSIYIYMFYGYYDIVRFSTRAHRVRSGREEERERESANICA